VKLAYGQGKSSTEEAAYASLEKDHGRIEKRRYWLVDELDWLRADPDWVGLRSSGMMEAHLQ